MSPSRKKLTDSASLETFAGQVRNCTRCAGCLPSCPTFAATGEEPLSPRGRVMLMAAVLGGELALTRGLSRRLSACLLCGACTASCPGGVKVSEAVLAMREQLAKSGGRRLIRAGGRRIFGGSPRSRRRFFDFGSSVYAKAPNSGFLPWRHQGLKRTVPRPARRPLEEAISETVHAKDASRRVALFPGCATSLYYQQTAASAVSVLSRVGVEVVFPRGLGCCGQPLRSLGDVSAAESLALENLQIIGQHQVDEVVTLCPSCAQTLAQAASRSSSRLEVRDIHSLLAETGAGSPPPLPTTRVAWHDPCHLGRGLGLIREPREIIACVPGVEYVEAGEFSCCGGGGLFCLQHYGLALKMGLPRAEELAATGARIVATGCPSCRMHLEDMLARLNSEIRVMHTVDLIDGGSAVAPAGK